jgi:hypothetical protein
MDLVLFTYLPPFQWLMHRADCAARNGTLILPETLHSVYGHASEKDRRTCLGVSVPLEQRRERNSSLKCRPALRLCLSPSEK